VNGLLGKIVLVAFIAGCPFSKTPPPPSPEISAEIATQTAYAVVRSRKTFRPVPPVPSKCCSKCTNGKVRSGDGIAWVPCPCPATCKCKAKP
jgi:hypothetical protein